METNNFLNLKYLYQPNISIVKALLLFYVIIASGFTKELYSGQLKDYLKTNRFAQHIIGFITMLVIISIVGGITNISLLFSYSLIAYCLFIFSTKLDIQWNLAIIGLLLLGFFYENNLINKEKEALTDEALDKKDIKKIKKKNKSIRSIIIISIIVLIIIGTIFYTNKKINQYGGEFDFVKYMMNPRNKN